MQAIETNINKESRDLQPDKYYVFYLIGVVILAKSYELY